jgi:hypothetical protein
MKKTMESNNQKKGGGMIMAFLAGVAATVAIGGYLLYGPKGRQHRKQVEQWVARAKAEILEKMDRAEEVTEEQYHKIVDAVMKRYGTMKEIGKEKAGEAAESFKRRWEEMREASRHAKERARRDVEEGEGEE